MSERSFIFHHGPTTTTVVGAAVVIPGAGLELARGAPGRVRGLAGAVLLEADVGGRVVGRGFGSGTETGHKQRMYDI